MFRRGDGRGRGCGYLGLSHMRPGDRETGRSAPDRESLGSLRPLLASQVGEVGVSVGWQLFFFF